VARQVRQDSAGSGKVRPSLETMVFADSKTKQFLGILVGVTGLGAQNDP